MSICWGCLDSREGKGVGDFEYCYLIHADQEAGRCCGKGLRAVLDDLHNHL